MTLGLLGGTFDPVHCGHLDVARAAHEALGLGAIWFIPARLPPHRTSPHASAAHRFAMAALAILDEPNGWRVSDLEMESPLPSYTAATLDRLEAQGIDLRQVCFITGADAFRDIGIWKDYQFILDRCHFAAVSRPGAPASGLGDALPALKPRMIGAAGTMSGPPRIHLIDAPTAPVSSTAIRQAIIDGRPLSGLVPDRVAAHIARHGLYARPSATQGVA